MAKKRIGELPSGSIRLRAYDYTDEDGKKHYRSFTADSKAKAHAMVAEWKANKKQDAIKGDTLIEEVGRYIGLKEAVLSPSTVRGYRSLEKCLADYKIANMNVNEIDAVDLQSFVSECSIGHKTKYVKNFYSLIRSAIEMRCTNFCATVTFRQAEPLNYYCPSNDDVQKLLDACRTSEEKIGILLAAVCFCRRGEACALLYKDVDFKKNRITISKDMVQGPDGGFTTKNMPKNETSYRSVPMSESLRSLIRALKKKDGYLIDMNPNELYEAFSRARIVAELPEFRYHDLRHHAASYAHTLGISDRMIEKMGGWKPGSSVLKRIYQNVIDDEMKKAEELFIQNQSFDV